LELTDAKGFEPSERMGRNHKAPGRFYFFSQLLNHQELLDVLIKSKNQDIPLIGRKLVSAKYFYPTILGQFLDITYVP
jgi:hypothetical protein